MLELLGVTAIETREGVPCPIIGILEDVGVSALMIKLKIKLPD
jgi:hypothetical protein